MSKAQRVRAVLGGLLMLLAAAAMALSPDEGYRIVIFVLGLVLFFGGLGRLVYFVTMARHMVDGRRSLYTGALLLDVGILALNLRSLSQTYVLLYLLVGYLFAGLVSFLRAREAKSYGSRAWRRTLVAGIVDVAIAVLCVAFIGSPRVAVWLYCAGLAWSACERIASAFRKTAIVYIA